MERKNMVLGFLKKKSGDEITDKPLNPNDNDESLLKNADINPEPENQTEIVEDPANQLLGDHPQLKKEIEDEIVPSVPMTDEERTHGLRDRIKQARIDNIKLIAEKEFDAHQEYDPAYIFGSVKKEFDHILSLEDSGFDTSELKSQENMTNYSNLLKHARKINMGTERDEWIDRRIRFLIDTAKFPKTNEERAVSGSICIPLPDSMPPALESCKHKLKEGLITEKGVFNILTDFDKGPDIRKDLITLSTDDELFYLKQLWLAD